MSPIMCRCWEILSKSFSLVHPPPMKMYLAPPKRMSVEELIGYMAEDEVIEVTPKSVRLRKLELDSGVRERLARTKKKQMESLKQSGKGGGKK